jgi:hypothetical protein
MKCDRLALIIPGKDVMDAWAKFDKDFAQSLGDLLSLCIELSKAAYGLKDAPLLWSLRTVLVLLNELYTAQAIIT